MQTDTQLWSYLAQFFLEWKMFQTKALEKSKHNFMFNNFFFRKSFRLWDVKKYRIAGQATDGNMAHAPCMLDTQGYRHTLAMCNTYCFSTATVVTRTHVSVRFIRIYSKQQCSVKHDIHLIYYIYWPWATCFDSLGIIIRPSLKIRRSVWRLTTHVWVVPHR